MSIKPIDSQISFTNSVNESRDKQNDINKSKIAHQLTESKQQIEVKNKQTQVQNNEEAKSKQFGADDKNHRSQYLSSKRNKKENKKSDQLEAYDHRGKRLDVRI